MIDKEFEKVADQINAKIKEATAALKQANKLANTVGLPSLIYTQWVEETDSEWDRESTSLQTKIEMIDVSELEGEIRSAGWSTSSSYC